IESKLLGETRRVRVALPRSYDRSKRPCGVLYLLDGESLFVQATGAVRHLVDDDVLPLIVVGVDNVARTRDLTPEARPAQMEDFPAGGGSKAFRRFLVDELRPFIESKYRVGPVRLLAGHSFGGLFAAETLLDEPDAFTGYLILSPSFWWDDDRFVERFESVGHQHGLFERFVWFGIGEEDGPMNGPFERVTWSLRQRAPLGFWWGSRVFHGEDHWHAALPALGAGLKAFMAPIREIANGVKTFEELEARAARVSKTVGVELSLGRAVIGDAARQLSKRGETDASIALLTDAMAKLADEPYFAYARSLALQEAGRYDDAVATLEAALEKFAKDPRHKDAVGPLTETLARMRGKAKGGEAGKSR
ncbi:MAG: alpha/beta hydrolase-fold protein, partial [Planctomycetota bacterium]